MNRNLNLNALLLSIVIVASAFGAPGDLDPTFNGDGRITMEIGTGNSQGVEPVVQTDGKIVVAGQSFIGTKSVFLVVRYNPNGSLDTTFDDDGKVFTDFPGSIGAQSRAIAIQSDGKIVVAGSMGTGSQGFFVIARYNSDGSLDTSFDSDGFVTFLFGTNSSNTPRDIKIQSDQKIVVVGVTSAGGTPTAPFNDFGVARLNSDGSFDTTFGTNGRVVTDFLLRPDDPQSAAIQPDGKIVVVGTGGTPIAPFNLASAVRYNSDGSLDTSFDGDGKLQLNSSISGLWTDIALQTDGKILCSGQFIGTQLDFGLHRLNADGSADGQAFVPIGAANDFANKVAIQPDGKIIVSGYSEFGGLDFSIMRLNSDLSLDTTFSGDGKARTDLGGNDTHSGSVLQPDGKIVLVGTHQASVAQVGMIRYLADGTLDTSLDGDGIVTTITGVSASAMHAAAIQSDGKILMAGVSSPNVNDNDFTLIRLDLNGNLDTTFSDDGVATANPLGTSNTARALFIQPDGKIVVAGHSIGSFQIARFNSDGTIDTTFNALGGQPGMIDVNVNSGFDDRAMAVALAPDGKIIVAGEINTSAILKDVAVIRLNQDGTRDLSFGVGGLFQKNTGSTSESARAVTVLPDGKILLATNAFEDTNEDFAVIRLNATGTADLSFGGDGMVVFDFGPANDLANSLAVQVDGKIVVTGSASNGLNTDIGIMRLNSDGTPDTTFSGDGRLTVAAGTGNDAGNSVKIQPDGKIIVGGFATNTNRDLVTIRVNADGTLDAAPLWGIGGISVTDLGGAESINAIAIQPNGRVVAVGESNGNLLAARFVGNFVPTAADGFVSGRVATIEGAGIRNATVTIVDASTGEIRTATTGSFGFYRFDALETGRTYIVTVSAKRYRFSGDSLVVALSDNITDADFIANAR